MRLGLRSSPAHMFQESTLTVIRNLSSEDRGPERSESVGFGGIHHSTSLTKRNPHELPFFWGTCSYFEPTYETHRLLSSSFLGSPYRLLNINHKKELLRGLWVTPYGSGRGLTGHSDSTPRPHVHTFLAVVSRSGVFATLQP